MSSISLRADQLAHLASEARQNAMRSPIGGLMFRPIKKSFQQVTEAVEQTLELIKELDRKLDELSQNKQL